MYVLNSWYVVSGMVTIGQPGAGPLGRLRVPVILFRKRNDDLVALADRCAHRAYPLSSGRLVDDAIECGYHGFVYGADGACTRVPAQDTIPARARVASYPILEKDGWIWIWPGDPEQADAALLPDTHWMNDPEWATVTHTVLFECRHDLIHDNLLDLTHEWFLHKTTVGDDYIYEHGITVEVEGHVVTVDRLMPGVEAPPLYARTMGTEGLYARFHAAEFHVPSYHVLHSGITGQGRPREEGYLIKVLNGITPVDADHTYYYYAFSRNFALDAEWATSELEVGLGVVLEEDAEALRLQEIGMKDRPAGEHDVLIGQDAGVAKGRRILGQLLAQESAAGTGVPMPTSAVVRRAPTPALAGGAAPVTTAAH